MQDADSTRGDPDERLADLLAAAFRRDAGALGIAPAAAAAGAVLDVTPDDGPAVVEEEARGPFLAGPRAS